VRDPVPKGTPDIVRPSCAYLGIDVHTSGPPNDVACGSANWRRRVWDLSATGIDGLTPHDLRHSAASLAIASGVTAKHVQRMLGHRSAAMTLDVYASLFEDDLDTVSDRLEKCGHFSRSRGPRTAWRGPEGGPSRPAEDRNRPLTRSNGKRPQQ
jgi:hypothetical protein